MRLSLSWTDICLWSVLIIICANCFVSLKKNHIREAYAYLLKKPLAVSSAIILLFFLIIGLLDSIHVKMSYQPNAMTLLDKSLFPLGETVEKTYSAPLALTLYPSELIWENGKPKQVHPRLKYPPVRLDQDKLGFIIKSVVNAGLLSLVLVLFSWISIRFIRTQFLQTSFKFKINSIQLTACITFFICFWLIFASYLISRKLHLLGTGQIGQDIFYYTLKSIRTGLVIGILTTLLMMPLALLAGIAAGYFGGIVDDIIQYIYTTLNSIPGVLLITASVLSMQTFITNHPHLFSTLEESADARLLALCIILGITSWTTLCRLLRAETLKLREIDFVLAARVLGSGSFKIIRKHLLPNVMHIVIITLVIDFSFLVLAEAVLSYVGVGVSPMTISWGNMINTARLELAREPLVWWPIFAAFLLMFILVLASNLLADSVRDAFDPKRH